MFARAAHFFVQLFAVLLHDFEVKLPETPQLHGYTFYGENVVLGLVPFFSLPLIFTLVTR